jgi:hypothetical protein
VAGRAFPLERLAEADADRSSCLVATATVLELSPTGAAPDRARRGSTELLGQSTQASTTGVGFAATEQLLVVAGED